MDLLRIVSQYRIIVDTCIWMYPPSKEFLTNILPEALFTRKATLKIPHRVIEEINRKLKDKDHEARKRAKFASYIMNKYIQAGLIHVLGDDDDPFADQTILYVFQKYSDRYNLCLITRDRKLAQDIHQLSKQGAVKQKDILLFGVKDDGNTYQWNFEKEDLHDVVVFRYKNKRQTPKTIQSQNHSLPSQPNLPKALVHNYEGTMVNTLQHGQLTVGKRVGSGKDGDVYRVMKGLVCKFYHPSMLTRHTYEKLVEMVNLPFKIKEICWPQDLVFNSHNEFIGFIMKEAKGESLQKVLQAKPVLEKQFPKWDRKEIVDLGLTLLRQIEVLHSNGIIIGNINLDNIFVQNEKAVFFINTDGFQVGKYQGDPSLINMTSPEALFSKRVERTIEDDYYALTVMLFMLLLPGKIPYSFQGGGFPGHHIKKAAFQFPFKQGYITKYGVSPWKVIWASLPLFIQEMFFETFVLQKRFPVEQWEKALRFYKESLKDEIFTTELFPKTITVKKDQQIQVQCESCQTILITNQREAKRVRQLSKMMICESCYRLYEKSMINNNHNGRTKNLTKKSDHNHQSFLDYLANYKTQI